MLGTNFPVSAYYKERILDAVTVVRSGSWWTAVLVIKDPRSGKPFLGLYRWQKLEDGWKTRSRFLFRRQKDVKRVCAKLFELSEHLSTD